MRVLVSTLLLIHTIDIRDECVTGQDMHPPLPLPTIILTNCLTTI